MFRKSLDGNLFTAMCSARRAKECYCQYFLVQVVKFSVWHWSLWRSLVSASSVLPIEVLWWHALWFCTYYWDLPLVMYLRGCIRVSVVKNGNRMLFSRRCWLLGKNKKGMVFNSNIKPVFFISASFLACSSSWIWFYKLRTAQLRYHSVHLLDC